MINGGSASRIFTEVHGTGLGSAKYSFELANGSSGAMSRLLGTVWVPYGSDQYRIRHWWQRDHGRLWSGTQVNIQSGVNIIHVPYGVACSPPTVTAVDAIVCSTEDGGNTAIVNLNDYVTLSGRHSLI